MSAATTNLPAPHDPAHPPIGLYLRIYVYLLVLLAVTVGAAYVHLGPLNIVVALVIASIKAWLVVMNFMHLRDSPRLNWIVAAGSFLWLVILIVGLLMDYVTRSPGA